VNHQREITPYASRHLDHLGRVDARAEGVERRAPTEPRDINNERRRQSRHTPKRVLGVPDAARAVSPK
jgi:hypothetical protein